MARTPKVLTKDVRQIVSPEKDSGNLTSPAGILSPGGGGQAQIPAKEAGDLFLSPDTVLEGWAHYTSGSVYPD